MSCYFEKVSRFADVDLPLPTRATANSAGYDFVVAEDIVIPPYDFLRFRMIYLRRNATKISMALLTRFLLMKWRLLLRN